MPGPSTAELNGLNWQVQVDPLTLSITSLPPTLAAFAAVDVAPDEALDELLDELPPQAVASMQTATNDMSHVKRFIDTLRSRFGKRQLITGSEFVRARHVHNQCGHLGNT
jgi:hypothetical protein